MLQVVAGTRRWLARTCCARAAAAARRSSAQNASPRLRHLHHYSPTINLRHSVVGCTMVYRHHVGGWLWGTLDPASLLFAMLRGRNAGTPSCSSLGGHSYELIHTPGRALQRTNPDHGFIQQRSLRRCLHGRPWIFVTPGIRPVSACIRGGARWHALSSAEK